jgi:pimeloyl-ACP methyl ester carboxylesterase
VTLIARGHGRTDDEALALGNGVRGRRVTFDYERSGHFDTVARLRREAERDAGEVLAVAMAEDATRAIGSSRGARAVVGALVERPDLFDRIVLVLPPSGTAAGAYSSWLASSCPGLAADVHVIAQRGDAAHAVRVAESWAAALGASLEVLATSELATPGRLQQSISSFLGG